MYGIANLYNKFNISLFLQAVVVKTRGQERRMKIGASNHLHIQYCVLLRRPWKAHISRVIQQEQMSVSITATFKSTKIQISSLTVFQEINTMSIHCITIKIWKHQKQDMTRIVAQLHAIEIPMAIKIAHFNLEEVRFYEII